MTEFNNYAEIRLAPDARPSAILKAAVERLDVSRFEVMEPSLYDIFIDTAKVSPKESQREEGGRHV